MAMTRIREEEEEWSYSDRLSETEPKTSSDPELGEDKGSVGSCLHFIHVSLSCVSQVQPSVAPKPFDTYCTSLEADTAT